MSRAYIALAVLGAAAIWFGATGSSGAAEAVCTQDGTTATVSVAAGGEVALGLGGDGRILVDGAPCAEATTATAKAVSVSGGPEASRSRSTPAADRSAGPRSPFSSARTTTS